MLGVGKQYNTIVVSARGEHLKQLSDLEGHLRQSALSVSDQAKLRFNVGRRATLDYKAL